MQHFINYKNVIFKSFIQLPNQFPISESETGLKIATSIRFVSHVPHIAMQYLYTICHTHTTSSPIQFRSLFC